MHILSRYALFTYPHIYRIGGVLAIVLASSLVNRGFEPQSKTNKRLSIWCFFRKARSIKKKEQRLVLME